MAEALALARADSPCLTDEEIVAFALGRLDASQVSTAHLHLDECEVCQTLLSEAARTQSAVSSENSAWNTTFRPGALVGERYLVRRFIARGGMGEVYEAFDRVLQERVALKTVTSTACDNPTAVRRLKAEVQLARRVSHENVCRIYDFGTHALSETGVQVAFLTMEFVDGQTLGARLREGGALPIPEARRLGQRLLLGLGAAHAAGVLHRDFKSDNVMLRDVEGQARPLILDFGLARAFDDDWAAGSVSNAGLLGTISYLAPEQLRGEPHTTASDIYSLGMVWFEMLTGELPFGASATAAVAALERMQKQAPTARSRNPDVPADLDAVVARCLSRSPKHRYQTTAQVLHALQALEQRAPGLSRRGKWWLSGAAACSLALGAALAVQSKPHAPRVEHSAPPRPADAPVRTAAAAPPVGLQLPSPDAGTPPTAVSQPAPTPKPKPRPQKPQPAAVGVDTGAWEDPFEVGVAPR